MSIFYKWKLQATQVQTSLGLTCYRYWINICQGIHDGPDTGVCSDSSASCRQTTSGQVDSLGVVTSQALTMEGRQHILYSMPNKKKAYYATYM